jgi:hypothetical protein
MAEGVSFKLDGLDGLNDALEELIDATSGATGKAALKRGLIKAAQPLVDRAKALVPKKTGKLAESIVASSFLDNKAGKAAFAKTLSAGGSKAEAVAALRDARREAGGGSSDVEVYVGPSDRGTGKQVRHAQLVEFGTGPHVIRARRGKALVFDEGGDEVGAAEVHHPGTPPRSYMRRGWDETQNQVADGVAVNVGAEIAKAADRAAVKALRKKA